MSGFFIKVLIVLRVEKVFQVEGPACAISQPLEDCKWENCWRVDGYRWVRDMEEAKEDVGPV